MFAVLLVRMVLVMVMMLVLMMVMYLQIGVRREVDKEEGQALADALGALFIETSAKQVCRRSENGCKNSFSIITNVSLHCTMCSL